MLNRRWNKVLDTEERYGDDRHTKSYPKRKLLPEFDDETIPEDSPDDDAFVIPEECVERDNLHRKLMATTRSLEKQKQRLKAA